jgi:hypothetical protein
MLSVDLTDFRLMKQIAFGRSCMAVRSHFTIRPLLWILSELTRTIVGVSAVNPEAASKLPNKTMTLPNQPDRYVIQLDVFHQLHCLNNLRKALWPERYSAELDGFFLPTGKPDYTSISAQHLGNNPEVILFGLVLANANSRSLCGFDQAVDYVPWRSCSYHLAVQWAEADACSHPR